ncbi:NAD(P)H-binding domain-containing protein [Sarocladium implicatum]|nr:NAD(P)H-binding domain-containing protein [Sarocladium implicatum]
MSSQNVFLIGPGYIGQEIIGNLLQQQTYTITALVRRETERLHLESIGVRAITGALDDQDIIQKQVALSDIVFHTATSDHLPSVEAIIKGIEDRTVRGLPTTYIHTSGASLVGDQSAGEFESNKIWDDEVPGDIDALPDSAHHRVVDLAILQAAKELGTHAKFAIMIPPVIYGVGDHSKRLSIQGPTMVRFALKYGYAAQIGQGLSKWSQVHIKDLARGYIAILHWLEGVSTKEANLNHYWFCENGEDLSWGDIAAGIGRVLFEAGRLPEPSVKTLPRSEYNNMFGAQATDLVLGSNARTRASRLRKLGWTATEKSMLKSLADNEIPSILEEKVDFQGYVVPGI